MPKLYPRSIIIGLLGVLFVSVSWGWHMAWQDTYAKCDVRDAKLAITYIEKMRSLALHSSPSNAVACLLEIESCYSPWRWKREDLHLQQLVENQRESAKKEVTEYIQSDAFGLHSRANEGTNSANHNK